MDLVLDLAQLFINGIAVGSIIALAAVGLTLTYGILRLPNFAHGDFMTTGAFLTFLFNTQVLNHVVFGVDWLDSLFSQANVWISIFLATIVTIGGFLICEFLIWSKMRDSQSHIHNFNHYFHRPCPVYPQRHHLYLGRWQ